MASFWIRESYVLEHPAPTRLATAFVTRRRRLWVIPLATFRAFAPVADCRSRIVLRRIGAIPMYARAAVLRAPGGAAPGLSARMKRSHKQGRPLCADWSRCRPRRA